MLSNLSRRRFLHGMVGAGALIVGVPRHAFAKTTGDGATAAAASFEPGMWLALSPDGTVTITTHRSEMGTGIRTSLPAVVADELGADMTRVKVAQAIGDARYGDQNTDGSRSVRDFYDIMRTAGASARQMLIATAADQWKVPATECTARDHAVHHEASKRSVPFGELAAKARTQKVPDEKSLVFRPASEYRYVGKDFPITDLEGILRGTAPFGMDIKREGMKYAAIARSPVLGGALAKHDGAEALKVKGVEKIIVLPSAKAPYGFQALGGVAVVASSTWAAFKGRDALEIEWTPGANASFDSDAFRKTLEETSHKTGTVVRKKGDAAAVLAKASKTHEADYYAPLLAHATMEPPVAVAHVTKDRCEAWAPVQNPQAAQASLAAALGIKPENVIVNVTLLGGGFGRKSKPDFVVEAALLSREVGAPVKVVWSREDDLHHDYFHSVSAVHLRAALDEAGKPTAILGRTVFPPIPSTFAPGAVSPSDGELSLGFVDMPFDVGNLLLERGDAPAHVRIGWLRAVCNVWHAFAACSFADELAHLAGKDPLSYVVDLIGPDRTIDPAKEGASYKNYDETLVDYPVDTGRLKRTLELAAKELGWGKKLPKGQGFGLAVHRSFCSYVAMGVEVKVSKDGRLLIPRVVVAIDCGKAISPDRVRAQMEGSVIFSQSLATDGAITVKAGKVEQNNFNDYRIVRIGEDVRDIKVLIVPSEAGPGGVGEPGVPPFAPALCNAVFAATGKRIRSLPLSKHDLSWS